MATLNIRIDDTIKNQACIALDKMNISQSDAVRMLFEYIAIHQRMPIKTMPIDDDADLVALVKTV